MRAVLLCAGRGRRLGSDAPKVLLSIDGKTLLERHLVNLAESGITELTIVTGFEAKMIEARVKELAPALPVDFVHNERFVHGSIVSLQCAIDKLARGGIWMDADVLYPAALMRKLVGSKHPSCVLLDPKSEESGEEMMVGVRAERCLKIARRVGDGWDLRGETVGFAKVGEDGARAMKKHLEAEVGAGRLDQEYEAAMDKAFADVAFGYERIDEFPWTEIDFEEDVAKANELVKLL
jgi:choline kinase